MQANRIQARDCAFRAAPRLGGRRGRQVVMSTSATSIERFDVGKRLSDMVIHNKTIYLAGQVPDDLTKVMTRLHKFLYAHTRQSR